MKKFAAMLLALMMMALPFAGLAESNPALDEFKAMFEASEDAASYYQKAVENGRRVTTTVTFSGLSAGLTGDAMADEVISDIVEALRIVSYEEAHEAGISIGMLQEATGEVADLMTLGAAIAGEEAYIASNLLGGTIAVSSSELLVFAERLIDMLAMIGMFEAEDGEQAKAMLPEMIQMAADYMGVIVQSMSAQEIDIFALKYDALVNAAAPILARMETAEVTMQPRNCDPAVAVMTVQLTEQDALNLTGALLQFIKDNPELLAVYEAEMAFMAAMDPEMAEMGSFSEMLDMLLAELQNVEADPNGATIDVAVYVDEMGLPTAAEIRMPEQTSYRLDYETYDYVDYTYVPTITMSRITMNDMVVVNMLMDMGDDDMSFDLIIKETEVAMTMSVAYMGETEMTMKMTMTDRSAENVIAADVVMEYEIASEYQPMSFKIAVSDDVTFAGVDYTEKAVGTLSVSGMDLFTINVEIASGEPGVSITEGNVIRPAQLSEADFANWFVGVYNTLFNTINTLPTMLPASFMNMMMSDY